MTNASLLYIDRNSLGSVILESGSLYYIDECTKRYKTIEQIKNSPIYEKRIKSVSSEPNGVLKLYRVKNAQEKEELPILVNDINPILNRDNYYEQEKSETEKSRKLLYNSKNRLFLKGLINNKFLTDTFDFSIKLSKTEYTYALKNMLPVRSDENGMYLRVESLFKYAVHNQKLGVLRTTFEDTLDIWKKRLLSKDDIDLYYYSRNLRVLQNAYYKKIKERKEIKNLDVRNENLIPFLLDGIELSCTRSLKDVKLKRIA